MANVVLMYTAPVEVVVNVDDREVVSVTYGTPESPRAAFIPGSVGEREAIAIAESKDWPAAGMDA